MNCTTRELGVDVLCARNQSFGKVEDKKENMFREAEDEITECRMPILLLGKSGDLIGPKSRIMVYGHVH